MKFQKMAVALAFAFLFFGCQDKKGDDNINESNTTQNIKKTIDKKSQISEIKQDAKNEQKKDNKIILNLIGDQNLTLSVANAKIDIQNNEKATLFVFFATWCPPCLAEIPHLNNLSDKFKKDLNIIGILLEDKSVETIEKFIHRHKIKYEISYGEGNYALEKAIGGVIGLPFSILYKKNGEHAITYTGLVPEEMLENDIKRAIK